MFARAFVEDAVPKTRGLPRGFWSVFSLRVVLAALALCMAAPALQAQETVDPQTGRLFLKETDLQLPAGSMILEVKRIFVGRDVKGGLLGSGWRMNWESGLSRSGSEMRIEEGTGTFVLSKVDGKEEFRGPLGERAQPDKDGGVLRMKRDGTTASYDKEGRLVQLQDQNGNVLVLSYEGRRLVGIQGPRGGGFKFTSDDQGRVTHVEASTGVKVSYCYSGGRLSEVQVTGGPPVRYHYGPGGALTRIDRPATGPVTLSYDDDGRVTKRGWADGSEELYERHDTTGTVRHINVSGGITSIVSRHDGRRQEITDPFGNQTVMEWSPDGQRLSTTGPTGNTSTIQYDAQGRLVALESCCGGGTTRVEYVGDTDLIESITSPEGVRQTMEYDPHRNLRRVKAGDEILTEIAYYPDGLVKTIRGASTPERTLAYYPNGRLRSETNALGESVQWEYDRRGNPIRRTDPSGAVTQWEFDAQDRVVGETDSVGAVSRYSYDPEGRMTRRTDAAGAVTRYDYDSRGRLAAEVDPLGRVTAYEYSPLGQLSRVIDPAGNVRRFDYDEAGRLVREVNPLGGLSEYAYDALGRLTSRREPAGGVWKYEYDAGNWLSTITDPSGLTAHVKYDPQARQERVADGAGRVLTNQYDAHGRMLKEVLPGGTALSYVYDRQGNLSAVSGSTGSIQYEYDPLKRLTGIKYPSGLYVRRLYDADGNLAKVLDNLGSAFTMRYNAQGLLSQIVDPTGGVTQYGYDQRGRLLEETGPAGDEKRFSYDAAGQLIGVEDSSGDKARFEYDKAGRLAAIHHPGGGVSRFDHDAMGNMVASTNPLGARVRRAYDKAGRLTEETDAQGRTTSYAYDAMGRLLERRLPGGKAVAYRYDAAGNLAGVDDGAFPIRYAYDQAGRMTRLEYPAIRRALQYQYDEAGLLRQFTDSEGRTIRYQYDAHGRLSTLSVPGDGSIAFAYDASDRLVFLGYPNGVKGSWKYDLLSRPVQISYSDRQGRELMGWSYSYDAAGNLVKAVDSSGQETLYRYGPGGQLLEEKGPSGTRRYSYLAGGNRSKLESNGKTVAYEYNAADQLLEAGDETFRYDADGNLVERTNPRGTTRYTYDAEQRLVKVGMPDGEEVSFGYAPTGQRIWRKDKVGLTWFVTDGMNLLAELDDKLERRAIYLHGPGIDNPLMMRRAGEVYNYHAGHLGNVAGLSDSNGKTVASYLIDAFGNLVERKGNLSNPFLFASRYYEESLGLYYYRARYYDSLLGRFVARDPLAGRMENPRSLNRYLYVLNNPVKARDPLGLDSDYTFWHYTDEKGLQGIRASGGLKYSPSHGIRPTLFLTDIPPNRATNPGQQFGVGASRIQYAIPVRLDEIKWNDKPLEMMPRDLQVRDPRYQHIFLVRGNENELLHLPRTATEQIEAVKWPPAGGGSPPPDPMRDTGAFEPIRPNEGRGIGLSRRNAAGTPQRPAPPQPGPSNRTGGSLAAAASGQTGRVTDFLQQHGGKVTIALTAAHVANCLAQGKTVADCAKEMAIGYIVGGAIVAVVGPTGALILGAAGGAYSIYHAGVEATQQWSDYQQRSAAYEGREHQTRINLQRLEEAVALERNKIQGNLSAAANDAARSCERLRAMASRASNYGNEARSALASLPPADTLGRIKALSEKCAKATQTRAKLEGIQQRVSGYAQQVAAALERLNGWAENCRTAEQASRVRDGYRNAAGLVKGIRQLAADARASGQGLFGLSGEANTIRAAVEKGEGAKYRIISLAGKAVEESSQFDSELARVPEVNQNLQAQCAAALRDIDSLRAGFPDALEPALDAKFQELRGLVSTFTSRNCSPDAAKGQFLSDRSSAVDARLEAENRLSALQGALSGLDGCESLDVSGLLASIESAESEAASHLLVHADLPGRAADCDKTANAGSGGTGGQGSGTGDQQSGTGSQGTEGTGRSGADLIDRFTDRETRRTREVGSRTPPPLPPYPGTGPGYEQGGGSAGGPNVLVPPPPRDWGDDARGGRGSGSGGTSSGGHKGGGSGGGKSPCPGGNCGPPKTAQFKCKTNSECWGKYGSSGYYCNRGSGQCVRCPSGQHGRKDGYPACHSE